MENWLKSRPKIARNVVQSDSNFIKELSLYKLITYVNFVLIEMIYHSRSVFKIIVIMYSIFLTIISKRTPNATYNIFSGEKFYETLKSHINLVAFLSIFTRVRAEIDKQTDSQTN